MAKARTRLQGRKRPDELKAALLPLAVAMSCLAAACDSVKIAPKIIVADGTTYIACGNLVWIGNEGGGLFGGSPGLKVSFTGSDGLDHLIERIKSLSVSDVPTLIPAPMPNPPPDPTFGLDSDGKNYKPNAPYTWADGTQAVLRNGVWKPVMLPNTVCATIR